MKNIFKVIVASLLFFSTTFNLAYAEVRTILTEDNPILRQTCKKVENSDDTLFKVLNDLHDTMKATDSQNTKTVGLSANQIGENLCVFVVYTDIKGTFFDEDGNPIDKQLEFINPKIINQEGKQLSVEGCASIPSIFVIVERPKNIEFEAYNRFLKKFICKTSDFDAALICHESEHSRGILCKDNAEEVFTLEDLRKNPDKFLRVLDIQLDQLKASYPKRFLVKSAFYLGKFVRWVRSFLVSNI